MILVTIAAKSAMNITAFFFMNLKAFFIAEGCCSVSVMSVLFSVSILQSNILLLFQSHVKVFLEVYLQYCLQRSSLNNLGFVGGILIFRNVYMQNKIYR